MIATKTMGEYLYNKLPEIYRVYDTSGELKKYISALCDYGLDVLLERINVSSNNLDPSTCEASLLPILCASFGVNYYPDVPDIYYRRLLKNVGELIRRRGTYNCVHYLSRVLTGMESLVDFSWMGFGSVAIPGVTEIDEIDANVLYITLLANTVEQAVNSEELKDVVKKFILDFVPFYVKDVEINADVGLVQLTFRVKRDNIIVSRKDYTLRPKILEVS